jgi:hypothetical protein
VVQFDDSETIWCNNDKEWPNVAPAHLFRFLKDLKTGLHTLVSRPESFLDRNSSPRIPRPHVVVRIQSVPDSPLGHPGHSSVNIEFGNAHLHLDLDFIERWRDYIDILSVSDLYTAESLSHDSGQSLVWSMEVPRLRIALAVPNMDSINDIDAYRIARFCAVVRPEVVLVDFTNVVVRPHDRMSTSCQFDAAYLSLFSSSEGATSFLYMKV